MKAVIYARYSSERQTEQSIEGQLHECYAYAEKNGIDVIHEYIDRAITGKTDERADFQRMIADSAAKQFEAVIVYKTDRFSRSRYDSAIYKEQLHKNGVRVLYAKEPIPDGIEGILLESLLEGMAEYYSAELSQKLRRGMHESALKCQTTGGNVALGYSIGEDKKFYIDERTAPVVRQIFEMYSAGASCVEICAALNNLGVKTSTGCSFNKNSLRTILKNEKYIGVYKCRDVRVEGGVPALIDVELFEHVQKRLSENARAPQHHRAKADYLLSGKLYCGYCGHGMTGVSGTGKSGAIHNYYKCVGKKAVGCQKKTVTKEWIEKLVCSETVDKVLRPDMIDLISERCAEISKVDNRANEEVEILQKQLADIEKSIGGILSAMEQGIFTRSTKSRLETLEKQKDAVEYSLTAAKAKTPVLLKHEIKYILSRFSRETSENLEAYNRDVIDCFVHKAFLYEDKLIVVYNISRDGKELMQSELRFLPDPDGGGDGFDGDGCSSVACSPPPQRAINEHLYFVGSFLILVSALRK